MVLADIKIVDCLHRTIKRLLYSDFRGSGFFLINFYGDIYEGQYKQILS